jgi:hypothetical protein
MNKYDKNGVYQLRCFTCHKKYIGQTGQHFRVRFREHYNDYKYANNRFKFPQLVIDECHAFGPISDVMGTIHTANKGRMLDNLEKSYIYKETQSGNQIKDKLTVQKNPIFEALIQHTPYRGQHPRTQ